MSRVTSTPKLEEDKIQQAKQQQLRVAHVKRLSVPEVTVIWRHQAHDVTEMRSAQIETKRRSFYSWLSQVVKRVVVCVVNYSFRPSEADNQLDKEVLDEVHHAGRAASNHPQLSNLVLPDPFSNPLPVISAVTTDVLTGPPPNTTHVVRLELHPSEQQQSAAYTYTVPAFPHVCYSGRRGWPGSHNQSRLPRSFSCTWPGQTEKSPGVTTSASSLDLFVKNFEHCTPDITLGGPKETYHIHCFRAGGYQCTATGLVFVVDGQGDVRYSVVSWDMDLLASNRKKPAGPLFDIECEGLTVRQIHFPHCEILSAGEVVHPLWVAHMRHEGLELISPEETTPTHVIANISSCSAFGLMENDDTPLVPIRALVAIFIDPGVPSLQVFLLPENVVLDQIRRDRARNNGNERFIETISDCELVPQRQYTLASRMELDSVYIQPDRAKFYPVSRNYSPTFQIFEFGNLRSIHLTLREHNGMDSVWGALVPLVAEAQRQRGSLVRALRDVWSEFILRVSMPMLQSLVNRLFSANVLSELEEAALSSETIQFRKARFLLVTIINKGEPACDMMVRFLRELDPYTANNLGLA
ncbi:caspase recruitment domain-containing protein 8-like [Hippocampus zosterae]|uniref:caspase recruitment domain-containing protein 8-like n=1 Tax=Hippocampus zosterae TaxID=109293 RepID=UPI00223E78C5|nr:caspase recruitment domain-containing protein 8-like [Hippocampus zosterae]